MGLAWINPLYLACLTLLAVPVLLHLVQKHQLRGALFPSLLFLKKIPRRERRRLEIRHWLLLVLRCLLFVLLILAFARPFLPASEAIGLAPDREDSVLVIDRSYSMRLADHWQQALALADERIGGLGAGDRMGLLMVDDEAEQITEFSSDAGALRGLLNNQAPGYRGTRLSLAIEQASRLLAGSNAERKRIVVISDFRASAETATATIRDDIEIETLPIDIRDAANAAITAVEVITPSTASADSFSLQVEISNRSAQALEQALTLTLDGRELARRPIRLAPASTLTETFDGLIASSSLLRGTVRLDDDALELDNQRAFIYSNTQQLPVLIVDDRLDRGNAAIFVENALTLSTLPRFRIEYITTEALLEADLADHAVVILNDISYPTGDAAEALAEYVRAGGALLVIAAQASQPDWPVDLLPGRPRQVIAAKPASAFHLADFDHEHPLAVRLGASHRIGLSRASIFSYRGFETEPDDRVVLRYNDGAPALLERQPGLGRVQVLTTTLDTFWGDLALAPAFLPFLQQNLRYLGAYEAYENEFRVGDIVDLLRYARALAGADVIAAGANGPLVVETPDGSEVRLRRDDALLELSRPGFYQIHQAARPGVEITLATTVDPEETGPVTLDLVRYVEDIRASATPATATTALNRQQASAREQQQQLAQIILLLALVLMLLEALSANWVVLRPSRGNG